MNLIYDLYLYLIYTIYYVIGACFGSDSEVLSFLLICRYFQSVEDHVLRHPYRLLLVLYPEIWFRK